MTKKYACEPCQRRKTKCDRSGVPCSQCKLRGIESKCRPGNPIPATTKRGSNIITKQSAAKRPPGRSRANSRSFEIYATGPLKNLFHGNGSLQSIVQQFSVGVFSSNAPTKSSEVKIALESLILSASKFEMIVSHFSTRVAMSRFVPVDVLMGLIYDLNCKEKEQIVQIEASIDDIRLLLLVSAMVLFLCRPEDGVHHAIPRKVEIAYRLLEQYDKLEPKSYADPAKFVLGLVFHSLILFVSKGIDTAYHSLAVAVSHAFTNGLHIGGGSSLQENAWLALSLVDSQICSIISRPNLISLKCSNIICLTPEDAVLFKTYEWIREVNLTYFGANSDESRREKLLQTADSILTTTTEIPNSPLDKDIQLARLMVAVQCLKILCGQHFLYGAPAFLKYCRPTIAYISGLHDHMQFHYLMENPIGIYNIFQLGILIQIQTIQNNWSNSSESADNLIKVISGIKDEYFNILSSYRGEYEWCKKYFAVVAALDEVEAAKIDHIGGSITLPGFAVPLVPLTATSTSSLSESPESTMDIGMTMKDVLSQFPDVWNIDMFESLWTETSKYGNGSILFEDY